MGIPATAFCHPLTPHFCTHVFSSSGQSSLTLSLNSSRNMAKQQKSSRISVFVAALSVLFLFLLVFNYYHSINIGKITTSNGKDENLHDHDHIDLRHFSVMNETLSGLNQELRRIMALHKTKLKTDSSISAIAVSTSSNHPHVVPVMKNVVLSTPLASSSEIVNIKTTPRPQGNLILT